MSLRISDTVGLQDWDRIGTLAPTPTLKGYAAKIVNGDTFELVAAVTQSAGARVSVLFVCHIYIF